MNGIKPKKKNIWILEDDEGTRFVFKEILDIHYKLEFFKSINDLTRALDNVDDNGKLVAENLPDLIMADLRLPDETFISIINSRAGKDGKFYIPFMIISSVDDVDVMRHCFSRGALDYLTKPFKKAELIVKLENIFAELDGDLVHARKEQFYVDPVTQRIHFQDQLSSPLTTKESQILALFRLSTEKAITRAEMLTRVWNDVAVSTKTLDVHLFNLRRKLSEVGLEVVFEHPNLYKLKKKEKLSRARAKNYEFQPIQRDSEQEIELLKLQIAAMTDSDDSEGKGSLS